MSNFFSTSQGGSASLNPQQQGLLMDAYSGIQNVAQRPYQAYGGQTVADMNGDQLSAAQMIRNGVSNNVGAGALNGAIGGTNQALNYRPMMIGSQHVQPGMQVQNQNVSAQNVQGQNAQAAQLTAGGIQQFINPYLDNVAGGMMSNMGRQLAQTQMGNSAAATAAGAYGGSRHGVVEAETNRGFFDTLGQNLGNIYSQGFGQAANLAQGNVANQQQTNLANQGVNMQGQLANQGANLQAGMANQGANMQAQGMNLNANMQGQLANQQTALQTGMANQGAQYQAANLGLAGSSQLAALSDQQRQQHFGNAGMLQQSGLGQQAQTQAGLTDAYSRWLEQQNYPLDMATLQMNAATSMPSFGQSSTQSSRPSTMSQWGQIADLGGAAMGFMGRS